MREAVTKRAVKRNVFIVTLFLGVIISVLLAGCGESNLWNVSIQSSFNRLAISTQAKTTPTTDLAATVPDNANTKIIVTMTQTGTPAQNQCPTGGCEQGYTCWNDYCYNASLT